MRRRGQTWAQTRVVRCKQRLSGPRAQRRDPSDVVALGETIRLVLKEVDYSSHPPTVIGTKNRLAVFVTDVPRHLSPLDTILAKVVDYGGSDASAEAVFIDYDN